MDRPLYASGRDGRSWFDQLKLCEALWPYMGRPSVTVQELVGSCHDSLSFDEVKDFIIDSPQASEILGMDTVLTPVALCWPMGFSWSSFVAQSVMIGACFQAGFTSSQLLTDEGRLVDSSLPSLSVATDDIVQFTQGSRTEIESLHEIPMAALDRAWEAIGIQAQQDKSYNLKQTVDVLGVALIEGCTLGPKFATAWHLLEAVLDLARGSICSPRALASLLGSLQWLNLLNRPLFSCPHVTYALARAQPEDELITVWPHVFSEIMHNLCLCPMWIVDLCAPWSSTLVATDASSSYGFGMCRAYMDPVAIRMAAAEAGKGPHHFTLNGAQPSEKVRPGTAYELPLSFADFRVMLSIKARHGGHSGYLEAEVVVSALRRMARSLPLHRHRMFFLVDAISVLSALQKGRSSAPTLRRSVRRASSLILAMWVRIRFGYVPSELNPADAPSRGKCGKPRRRPIGRVVLIKFEQYCMNIDRSWRKLCKPKYSESLSGRASSCSSCW